MRGAKRDMATNFAKRQRRLVGRSYRRYRNRVVNTETISARPRLGRFFEHFDLVAVDHGIFRFAYLNLHEIAPGVWRSAQPGPRDIRRLAKRGLRTVVNLRGKRDCGSYRLEQQVCEKYGVRLVNFKMGSRAVPKPQQIHAAAALFEEIEYPVLIHCKSGADRAGLMAALYLLLREGRPLNEATRQLSLRYGHFKQADTGVLDHFFESYRRQTRAEPMEFMRWVDERYRPKQVAKEFKPGGVTNFLVNRLLKRE
jgi:protein tyrosine/serine phosphatase